MNMSSLIPIYNKITNRFINSDHVVSCNNKTTLVFYKLSILLLVISCILGISSLIIDILDYTRHDYVLRCIR